VSNTPLGMLYILIKQKLKYKTNLKVMDVIVVLEFVHVKK